MPRKKVEKVDFIGPKIEGIARSKRAALLKGEKGRLLYDLLKECGVKLVIDQALVMPQHEDGKAPFARYVMVKDFRVVLDLTE
jgi:hypothetical protein